MLFKLSDGAVTEIDIISETFRGGYCETWFYDYEAQGIEYKIIKDSGKVISDKELKNEIYGDEAIEYSDLMKFILNGTAFFEKTSSNDFRIMIKNYLEDFDQYKDKNFYDYSDLFYERLR